jgi:hypothetical protein
MGKAKLILGFAVLALAIVAGWQIAACELANAMLREELRDLAAQNAHRMGLAPLKSDEDFRSDVIRLAKAHEIQLEPEQVTVQRSGLERAPTIYLAVDFNARVGLPGFSFTLHFNPSSAR